MPSAPLAVAALPEPSDDGTAPLQASPALSESSSAHRLSGKLSTANGEGAAAATTATAAAAATAMLPGAPPPWSGVPLPPLGIVSSAAAISSAISPTATRSRYRRKGADTMSCLRQGLWAWGAAVSKLSSLTSPPPVGVTRECRESSGSEHVAATATSILLCERSCCMWES